MEARIVRDEPFPASPGAEPTRSVTIEISSKGWSAVETFVVTGTDPDEAEAQLDAAVRAMLRKAGRSEKFVWVRSH
jgi:hypothetical protein